MDVGIDPMAYYQDYPTPSATSQAESSPPPTEPPKKKRKAWGQPVPEIKQILPPRKRAKTEAEKEQRKHERILRNRRAADKSRQRQKAAVAELEVKTGRIEKENLVLRNLLEKYQQRFGVPDGFQFTEPVDEEIFDAPTPISLNDDATNSFDSPYQIPAMTDPSPQPTLVKTETTPHLHQPLPSLTPTLVESHDSNTEHPDAKTDLTSSVPSSVMTHYPAVSDGFWEQAGQTGLAGDFFEWPEPPTPGHALSGDLSDVLHYNALADVPSIPDVGAEIGREFSGQYLPIDNDQLSIDSLFDFNAFDGLEKSGLPLETPEPATSLQSFHGAPINGSD